MATLEDIHDADMAVILADAGNTATIGGVDYAVIATDVQKNKDLELGGFIEEFDLALQTRTSLFATLPAENTKLTFRGQEYRITKTRKNCTNKLFTMLCMSAAK